MHGHQVAVDDAPDASTEDGEAPPDADRALDDPEEETLEDDDEDEDDDADETESGA